MRTRTRRCHGVCFPKTDGGWPTRTSPGRVGYDLFLRVFLSISLISLINALLSDAHGFPHVSIITGRHRRTAMLVVSVASSSGYISGLDVINCVVSCQNSRSAQHRYLNDAPEALPLYIIFYFPLLKSKSGEGGRLGRVGCGHESILMTTRVVHHSCRRPNMMCGGGASYLRNFIEKDSGSAPSSRTHICHKHVVRFPGKYSRYI